VPDQLHFEDGVLGWKLPPTLRENEGLAILGSLQDRLSHPKVQRCRIDLTDTEWVDPQPLLCLGLVLAESGLPPSSIELDLGSAPDRSTNHRTFLKFLARQGFLTALAQHETVRFEGKIEPDIPQLRLRLAAQPQAVPFSNSDCIHAQILPAHDFHKDSLWLKTTVEKLIKEAQERALETAFGGDPLARDMLFQKMTATAPPPECPRAPPHIPAPPSDACCQPPV